MGVDIKQISGTVKEFLQSTLGKRLTRKFFKWLFFTLTLSFLSFATDMILPFLTGQAVKADEIAMRGEPLLISLALAAGGVGELFFDRRHKGLATIPQGIAIGISILIIALSSICFGAIKFMSGLSPAQVGATTLSVKLSAANVSSVSMSLLIASVLASLACVILSGLEPK